MTADTPTADGAFAARQKTWRHAPRRIEYRLIGLSFLAAALIALATGRPFLPGLEKYGMRAVQAVMLLGSATLVVAGLLALATRDPRGPLAVLLSAAGGSLPTAIRSVSPAKSPSSACSWRPSSSSRC